ncbi:unnamed protein product, partial [Polarella glacialis]
VPQRPLLHEKQGGWALSRMEPPKQLPETDELNTRGQRHQPTGGEESAPPELPQECFDLNNWRRSLADLLVSPLTHLLWSKVLDLTIARRRPDLWNSSQFLAGTELAVRAVYERLALADFASLRQLELLDGALLGRLEAEPRADAQEGWSKPPELVSARVLSLLWSRLLVGDVATLDDEAPRIRVTSLVLCAEAYSHRSSEQPKLVRRLQRWTFERSLESGSNWTVVQIGPESWYWRRPEELE